MPPGSRRSREALQPLLWRTVRHRRLPSLPGRTGCGPSRSAAPARGWSCS
ncbi:hypothetical protein CSAL01_13612 [Colletotrichum salicis]|uniref:Uncharacterized protein n=1 Tax=Colletotrichum salicis TaxID=1209931 RepID=A0A135UHM6_9PEZI|nr:hypothetical protein CSAL01_13612 [Colletotrichum salicis]